MKALLAIPTGVFLLFFALFTLSTGQGPATSGRNGGSPGTTLGLTSNTENAFYVATNGSDSNPGTFSQPFLTLDKARQAVRSQNSSMTADITVFLRGGRYELSNTLAFDEADSGTDGHNIIYKSYQNEVVTISGGVQVTGWTQHSGSIYKASVGTNRFRQFYVEGARGIRAREPDSGFYSLVGWDNGEQQLNINSGEINALWVRLTGVEMVVQRHWNVSYLRVAGVSGGAVTPQDNEREDMFSQDNPPRLAGQQWHAENALELLDSEGEWYLNTDDNHVYYQLRAGESAGSIEAYRPNLERLVQIKGSALGTNVHNLKFVGLTFEHSNWLYPNSHGAVWDQGNVVYTDPLPADEIASYPGERVPGGVYLENADHLTFERCTIRNMGGSGIQAHVAVTDSTFVGNVFTDIAATGLVIDDNWQGNPADTRKICARNVIKNNYLTRTGADYWGTDAIQVGYGESTIIEHNEITDVPSNSISVGWGWENTPNAAKNNLVRYNLCHDIIVKVDDMGALYTLSDQPGTRIEENYVYNVSRANSAQQFLHTGIMLDDGSNHILVQNNVLKNIADGNLRMNNAGPNNNIVDCCLDSDEAIEAAAGIEPAYQSVIGLVAAYGFEEGLGTTTADASGNGHTGVLTNGPAWTAGQFRGGLLLDGINDYVSLANADDLKFGGSDFSVAAWLKRGSVGTEDTLLSKSAPGGWATGGKEIFIDGTTNRLCLGSFDGGNVCSTGMILADGSWHYVAVTFSDGSDTVRFFLDGQASGTRTLNLGPDVAGQVIKLGANDPQFFQGQIDEVRIFSRTLSPSAVQTTMNAPVSPVTVPVSVPDVAAAPGSNVSIPITVSDLTGLGVRAYDLQITFNPLIVQPGVTPYNTAGTLSSGMSITPNATSAGHLILSAFQAIDLSGSGTLLKLNFTVVGSPAQNTSLAFQDYTDPNSVFHPGFRFNAGNPQASTTNGSITVNTAPTITPSPVTRQAGSPASGSTIATVDDIESGANNVAVNVTSANPSNGVTVSNIVNTAGTVTADVVAACGATSASFTLTATDGSGATATATLNVTVNPNTPPTLTYSPAALPVGGSTTINPSTGPVDNGSIVSILVQSQGTYTGTIGVNSSGVVSISGAVPFGLHTITIRATDNCGATTDTALTLDVTDTIPPDTSIDSSPANPSKSSSASFTFSGNDSGSGVGSFECKLDGGTFAGCTSPASYESLSDGSHTFQVRAIDNAGNQDPTPATYPWIVDTTGPTTTIESAPTNPTNSTSATFVFSAVDVGSGVASFECALDAGSFAACSSPTNYPSLSAGSHAFQVRAIDNVGNVGSAKGHTWVINAAPTITASAVTRQSGSPISNSIIATVNDAESGAGGVTVTINGGATATVDGVTVSSIVNTSGTVTADVVATCGATNAGFTLTVTDGGGATATATLNVTVNPNPAPTLVYSSPQSVVFGTSLNVTPTTATDNGSIAGYSLQSVVPALTTAPTVDASGVVSVTNAQPSGSHVITIRVTDNCGLTTDAQFSLDVGAAPQFSIDDVTHMEGIAGTTSYTFTITKTGNTAVNATVDWATVDDTATSPSDFTAIPPTTLTFLPADMTKQVTVLVNGDPVFEPNETFTVHLSNANGASISDADGTGTITNDDLPSISGRVLYADTGTPVRSVTLTLTGPSFTQRTTTTDPNGDYTFAGVPSGNDYTVTPSKTGDVNGLESLDASDVARYAAGLDVPSANQRIAADADDDGTLTSFDASLIARYLVGLPSSGIVGTWKFVPVNLTYQALSGDQSGQNFTAILVGDTGGNWAPAFASGNSVGNSNRDQLAAPSSLIPVEIVPVALPNAPVAVGSSVSVPITVPDLTELGVRAYDLHITFNPSIVQPQATPYDTARTLSSGMCITPNATNAGRLIISAFQATRLSGSGALVKIKFTVVGAPEQITPLAFEDYTDPNSVFHPGFKFNAGNPQAGPTNGSLTINGPTAGPAGVSGRITTSDGSPLGGTTLRLSGAATRTTVTDAGGNYRFENLDTDNFYSVSPSLANYSFSPSSRSFTLNGNMTDAGFTGNPDAAQSANAIDTTEYFVRQHYLDFLGREPDQGGLDFWSAQINQCNGDANCIRNKRIDVSAAFFASAEFQQTGSYIYGVYAGALGRTINHGEFSADRTQVLGGAGLEQAKTAFAEAFVQRAEFTSRYPQSMTREQFVDAVLQTMQQRSGINPASLRDGFLSDYDTGGRALVARHASEASDFVAAEYNKAFVLMEYFGYLRRPEDAGGYAFWLDVLDRNGGNHRGMVCAFITSAEYQGRFGALITHNNGECAGVQSARLGPAARISICESFHVWQLISLGLTVKKEAAATA